MKRSDSSSVKATRCVGTRSNRNGASHRPKPTAISSPGVVTRHKLALCSAQKVKEAAVIAMLIERLVIVMNPRLR
jgi:hypothetical protein